MLCVGFMATYDRQDGIGIVYDDLLDDQDSTTGMHTDNMHRKEKEARRVYGCGVLIIL